MKSEVWCLKSEGVAFIILRKSFLECTPCAPWIFFSCLRQEILEEILFKMLLRKKYFREIAILNRFLGRLGPQIFTKDFLQDFLRKQHET